MGKKKKAKTKKKPETKVNKRLLSYLAGILVVLLAVIGVIFMSGKEDAQESAGADYSDVTRPVATIALESGEVIRVELDPTAAPNTR